MSNGKVQTETAKATEIETANLRKSKIRMGIQRTLTTAKFESIVIHYEIEEDITWPDAKGGLKERQKKVDNWRQILTQEYQNIHDRVLGELNLSHKKAYFRNHLEEKDNRPDPNEPPSLDSLDELDVLE